MTEFKGPIVEGAYYSTLCERIVGPMIPPACGAWWTDPADEFIVSVEGEGFRGEDRIALTRRVYLVPTDPAEVVAELRKYASRAVGDQEVAMNAAADLVAERLVGGK